MLKKILESCKSCRKLSADIKTEVKQKLKKAVSCIL